MTIISNRIKNYREKLKEIDKKWTQQYVADKIGVARVTYTAYENGTKMPPIDMVNRIAELFDVRTDYLTGRTTQPKVINSNEYDSLAELKKIVEDYNIEDLFFHNIDDWKNFTQDDIEDIRNYIEFMQQKAKKRKDK
ncbi:helix-turn-helix domain-containing protein [Oceanobacillus sp. CF4.6]|uniref:helix-turn-helix domain-containing protein n=1 Tax=Oceanobacillus sp. CF4.6 TaxID=3373080 RepID=UPI003EE808BD